MRFTNDVATLNNAGDQMNTPARAMRSIHGFTLVEVLMAVLILAIGLLGLGAVLPMIVRQQRNSADSAFGTIAARSAMTTFLATRMGGDETQDLNIAPALRSGLRVLEGTFQLRLRLGGQTTGDLPARATAEDVQDAIDDLLGADGRCTVTLAISANEVRVYTFTFTGLLGRADIRGRDPTQSPDFPAIELVPNFDTPTPTYPQSTWTNGGPDLSPEFYTRWASDTGGGQIPEVRRNIIPREATWLAVPLDQNIKGAAELGTRELVPMRTGTLPVDRTYFVPLSERLYPPDTAGVKAPQFVYDLAVRRMTDVSIADWMSESVPPAAQKVQVAIFTRRTDARLPKLHKRMHESFRVPINRSQGPPPLWPVSVDDNGRPTLTGPSRLIPRRHCPRPPTQESRFPATRWQALRCGMPAPR